MYATIQRPTETLENRLIEIYERFDGGEEGYVRRALIDGKNYVLKEFKVNNKKSVLHSYHALNELKKLGFKIIEDYGIVKTSEEREYLLLKDLGNRVWAEQGNGRGVYCSDYPEVEYILRRNKLLSIIHGIGFGINDEHMIYENEKGELDACITDVGMFHKRGFNGVLAQKVSREDFISTSFREVYSKLIESQTISDEVFTRYEKIHPNKLEEMFLEYEAFISHCFHISPKNNTKIKDWVKRRGYGTCDNFFNQLVYMFDELYYFENRYKKKLLSFNISDLDDFDKFDVSNLDDEKNINLGFKGIDFAFLYALDRDFTRMLNLVNNGFDINLNLTLVGRYALTQMINSHSFDREKKVLAKVCMDPGIFERQKRKSSDVIYANILIPIERAFMGVKGITNSGFFKPEDIKGFTKTRFVQSKSGIGLDIVEKDFKLKGEVKVSGDEKFGYTYYTEDKNGKNTIIHTQYEK